VGRLLLNASGRIEMHGNELAARISDLARRMQRVEEELGLTSAKPEVTGPAEADTATEALRSAEPQSNASSPAAASWRELVRSVAKPAASWPASPGKPAPAHLTSPNDTAPPLAKSPAPGRDAPASAPEEVPPPGEQRPPRRPRQSLELRIGAHWMAWVGSAIVLLAVSFFVKLAYDSGWFGLLSPAARCLVAAGFGGALLVLGEVARGVANGEG
jgi:uncharacterized membrane protein